HIHGVKVCMCPVLYQPGPATGIASPGHWYGLGWPVHHFCTTHGQCTYGLRILAVAAAYSPDDPYIRCAQHRIKRFDPIAKNLYPARVDVMGDCTMLARPNMIFHCPVYDPAFRIYDR